MFTGISRKPARGHDRVKAIEGKPLLPSEYCKKWVNADPDEYGYKQTCINVLARVTGASPRSIERWGNNLDGCPEYVKTILRKQDILNQISLLLRSLDEIEE